MSASKILFRLTAVFLTVVSAFALTAPAAISDDATKTPASKNAKQKSTDVNFEDLLVQGKYHFSDEAVTTVEDDKVLDALLGTRTEFKDRIKKSASRR